MPIVTIKVSDNTREIAARLSRDALTAAVVRGMDLANEEVVNHIQKTKLTLAGPKYLNVRTGRLRRSARKSNAVVRDGLVTSSIGSNVSYAAVHEFGFQGVEQVRGFVRRQRSRDAREGGKKRGKLLASGVATVKPFTRKVDIRERRMFRDGIEESSDVYTRFISAAMKDTMEGRA